MPPRLFFAHLAQRVDGQRDQAQRFARRIEAPSRDGNQSVVGQVLQVIAEGVGGVEVVFGERESAGGGGRPGVHQGGLQHLVFVFAAAHEAAAVLHEEMNLGTQIEVVAEPGEALAHDGVGDDAVDLDRGDIGAAAVQRARHVPPAARSDDQRLGAGAHGIRQRRTLQREIAAVVRSEIGEIEFRNRGGRIGVDDNAVAAIGLAYDADPRKVVPLREEFVGDGLPFGMPYGEHGVLVVVHQEGDQRECQRHAPGAPAHRPGQAVPDRGSDGKRDRRGDHRVRTAHQFEQRQQQQASRRGARQVVEVDPVHLLDGFADDGRDDGARR